MRKIIFNNDMRFYYFLSVITFIKPKIIKAITNLQIDEISYNSKKVLYVGGQAEIKGFYTLIAALKYIDEDIKIFFAGNFQSNSKTIRQKIKSLLQIDNKQKEALIAMRANSQVIEVGMVTDIFTKLNQSCCLISPFSSSHFSRPIIEAFAMKKTVIGTNIPAITEVVSDGINGIIVKKDNPKELARAINYICNKSTIAMQLGQNGYDLYIEKFTPKNIEMFEIVYRELFNEK